MELRRTHRGEADPRLLWSFTWLGELSYREGLIEEARWFTRDEVRVGAEEGTLILPGGISISRSLVEAWYGGTLPGHW